MGRTATRKQKNLFDASASAVGYLFQCRYGLLLALQRDDSSEMVSLEKLDDVAFIKDDLGRVSAKDLLQFKHHITRQASLSDSSPDLWNTLRIWAQAILDKKIDPAKVVLTLVTTAVASPRSALRFLRPSKPDRNPAEAQELLEAAGAKSKNNEVQTAYKALMKLSAQKRKELFDVIHLLDASPQIQDVRQQIEKAVRYATDQKHLAAFVDRLEGWWFRKAIEHFVLDTHQGIPVADIQRQVHELREEFKRENLPDEFHAAEIPDGEISPGDDRLFVQQLHLIVLRTDRIRTAQEDHYRAFAQRSKWVKDTLMNLDEIGKFEIRLIDEWKHKRQILQDEVDGDSDEPQKVAVGLRLFNWTQETAPGHAALFIRPLFQSQYMVRGSFHMLADSVVDRKPRVGWHPEFDARLPRRTPGDGRNA